MVWAVDGRAVDILVGPFFLNRCARGILSFDERLRSEMFDPVTSARQGARAKKQ